VRLIDYPRRHKRGVRRWLPSWKLVLGTSTTFAVLLVAGFLVALSQTEIPKPNGDAVQQATIFTYADASTQISHIGTNRRPVTFDQIPLVVRQAVLAAEDRTFYSDPGVSPSSSHEAFISLPATHPHLSQNPPAEPPQHKS